MKIVVLAGGTSTEREVSIVSGTGICRALRTLGHEAVLLDVFAGLPELADDQVETYFSGDYDVPAAAEAMRQKSAAVAEEKRTRRSFFGPQVLALCRAADFVFLALHGANGEDGRVQATFDLLGVRYSGTDYVSSAIAMDKARTKQVFTAAGVSTPHGLTVHRGETRRTAEAFGLSLPVIVKPCCGGSSVGCTICRTEEELAQGLSLAFSLETSAVIEEFIEGREFTCAVIDHRAYPVVEIAPKSGYYDYHNKYQAGATVETCPAALSAEKTAELQALAVQGYDALGLSGYGRLDFLMRAGDDRLFCLEANTLPGMTPTSLVPQEAAAVGIDYPHLCQLMIDVSLKKYRD